MLKNKKQKGCVYFFRHLGLTPVKIGYSENESPKNRFNQFKTYAPYGAEMLGFIITDDSKSLETNLHKKYSDKRLSGEWFEITEKEVNNEINYYTVLLDRIERSNFWEKYAESKNSYDDFDFNLLNEIIDFIDLYIKGRTYINRLNFRKDFLKISKNKNITAQKFNILIRKAFTIKNIDFIETKYNGEMVFKILKNTVK